MKMRFFTVPILSLLLFLGCEKPLYQSGRDTYLSFGNGRFQLMRGVDEVHLHDLQEGLPLVEKVVYWRRQKELLYLVAGGNKPFWVVDWSTGVCRSYQTCDGMSEMDRRMFEGYKQTFSKSPAQ